MFFRIYIQKKNLAFKIYCILMGVMLIARYLLKVNIPSVALLLIAAIPAVFGSTSELLASVVGFIPLSAAFQYKYALLISMIVMILKNRWRTKSGGAILLVIIMMIWELLHFTLGYFSPVEYVRDFAELLFMGALILINIDELDYKLIIRSLSFFTAFICVLMLVMQLQQNNFDIIQVFSRSASSWRFGQDNMDAGIFALNFDANILGFICNLSACGLLLLRTRKEHEKVDIVIAIASLFFALITLSRAAIICMLMIIAAYAFGGEQKGLKRFIGLLSLLASVTIVGFAVYRYIPTIFSNLLERFNRNDVWNGRGDLFTQYMKLIFSSPTNLLFGIGMQGVIEKASMVIWTNQLPHNGLQEALVVWGIPGLVAVLVWIVMIVRLSMVYSGRKRAAYQFAPLLLTLFFVMSVQMLSESRTLLALSFSYICLCIGNKADKLNAEEKQTLC